MAAAKGAALETVKKLIAENSVMVFSGTYCPYCTKAKKYLAQAGANAFVVEIDKARRAAFPPHLAL